MKKLGFWLAMMMLTLGTAQAEGLEGKLNGSLVSYVSSSNDGTTSSMDMYGVPIVGFDVASKGGDWEVGGTFRILFDDGAFDLLDQNITLDSDNYQIYFGHSEFMDHSLGGENIVWIEGGHYLGAFGIEGREDIFQLTLKDAGFAIRYAANSLTADSETFNRTFTSAVYKLEGDSLAVSLAANSATDAASDGPIHDGQTITAVFFGAGYTLSEGTALSLNFQQDNTTPGNSTTTATNTTTVIVADVALGEGQGVTFKVGSVNDGSATSSVTDVSYANEIAPETLLFVAYTGDGTATETGAGLFVGF